MSWRWSARKMFFAAAALLAAAVFIEQTILENYVTPAAERQDTVFKEYINSLSSPTLFYPGDPQQPPGFLAYKCVKKPVAVIYYYRLCVSYWPFDHLGDSKLYELALQPPSGYLSLIPQEEPNEILWGGHWIYEFDESKKILADLRKQNGNK